MTQRKIVKDANELKGRMNELCTVRTFLKANYEELNSLRARLEAGDKSVRPRINELFDLISEKRDWIARNLPIIKAMM